MTERDPTSAVTVALLIVTGGVIVGFLELPYGYFQLLRLALCGVSLFLLLGVNRVLQDWHRWALGGFAVLYNPVFPIYLGQKLLWEIINIATIVLFWVVRAYRWPPDGPGSSISSGNAEAVRLFRREAEQGSADAQHDLGMMYADGEVVPQDDAEAVRWFRRAAEQGNASGQFRLGVMYEFGRGVPQDETEAVRWYRRAAEQGHTIAQGYLKLIQKTR